MKRTLPANTMDVKRLNRSNTLRAILQSKKISQPELAQKVNLSWPTVLQNVKELTALGLVQEAGMYESTGGRKAKAYAPIRDAKLAAGLDITQNHISLVLVNLAGEVLRYTRKKRGFSLDAEYLHDLEVLLMDFIEEDEKEKLLGVGISLPGIISESGEQLIHSHVLKLYHVETSCFSSCFPWPCAFVNDANAAGFAELWNRPEADHLVYLSLSNTVGGAVVNGGKIYAGNNLRAGEFGHMTLVPGGRPCYCGQKGCADAYLSAKLLAGYTDGNLAEFFDRLRDGDGSAEQMWQEYMEYLAIAVNNLRMSFDCEIIAGGYVGAFLEEFGAPLKELLAKRNTFEEDGSYLEWCSFKLEASAAGAALLLIERFLQEV